MSSACRFTRQRSCSPAADTAGLAPRAADKRRHRRVARRLGRRRRRRRALCRARRLAAAPDEVLADDPAIIRELREAFPTAVIAHRRQEYWALNLDALFEVALAPTLALRGGGSIHIAETRAATLIDVDTGTPEVGSA